MDIITAITVILIIGALMAGAYWIFRLGAQVYHQGTLNAPPVLPIRSPDKKKKEDEEPEYTAEDMLED